MSDLKKVLVDIADAIRYKMSSDAEYAPVDFADQILEIPTSGGGYSDPTPIINGTVKTVSNSASFTRAGCLAYCSKLTTANLSNCQNVGSSTFYDCNKLRAVHLENCKVINEYAFYSCSALSKIDIPLCERIEQEAFHWAGLQSISLPSCSYIGNGAFQGCNSLVGDPHLDVCEEIGSSAFNGAGITTLNLPECVSISSFAFQYNRLSEWSFPKVEYIGANAFNGAIERPNYSASVSSTLFLPKCSSIGSRAFSSCGLVSVSLPECKYIGPYAFAEYNSCYITELILPKAEILGYGICNMNTYESSVRNRVLTKVYIPECTTLDYGQYYNWHGCFNSHTALSEVFAPKMTHIANGAFYGCTNLTSLTLNWSRLTAANRGAFNRVPLKELRTPYLGTFSSSAFEGCTQLSIIETPKVRYIEQNAIRGTKASCLELPEATYVQAYGVGYCDQLETVETYQLYAIYSSAFCGCTKLENFVVLSSSCALYNTNAFASTPLSDETLLGHFGSIYIPSEYVASYKTASNWSNYADRITELTSEIINKYIRASEFNNSTISSIPVERRNAKYIFNNAFYNCVNLTDASLPNCIYLSDSAFYGNTSLSNVYLPKCIIMGNRVFMNCSNLTSAYLPAFYSYIPEGLFYNCSNLSNLVISSDVTTLYASCFESCAISSICLVNCSFIDYEAFRYCKNLSAVYLLSTERIAITSPYYANSTAFYCTPMYDSTYLGSFGSIFVRASLLSDYVNYCASDSRNYYLSSRFVGLTDEQVEEILNIFYPDPEY